MLFYAPAAAAFGALIDIVGVAWRHGGGRAYQTGIFWLAEQLLYGFGVRPPWPAAAPLAHYHPVESAGEGAALAAAALIANAAAGLLLALLSAPVALVLGKRLAARGGEACERRFWERAYPAAVLVALTLPGLVHVFGDSAMARTISESPAGRAWLLGPVKLGTAPALLAGVVVWWLLCFRARSEGALRFTGKALFGTCVLALALSGIVAAAGWLGRPAPPEAPAGPNILLISIDSLRSDHVHAYGYHRETTPALDRLAREGALFRQAVAPTTWTLPSHLTMLTALPPHAHQVIRDGRSLDPQALTLAEVLSAAGYETAAFVSGPYLRAEYGFSQGFQHYDDYTVTGSSAEASHRAITSPALVRLVSSWLRQWDGGGRRRPFFLFVHMWDVHYDYIPPPPYDTLFDPEYHGSIDGRDFERSGRVHAGMDPRDLEHVIALYDGEIRYTDGHIGRMLKELEGIGALDNTVVAVTADHGDEFFEHGKKGHRNNLYDTTLLVPLIMRYPPKVRAGTLVQEQVRLLDLAPTLLSLAGVEKPPGFGFEIAAGMGPRDLTPLLAGQAEAGPGPPAFGDLHGKLACVRTGKWKFITRLARTAPVELYDLEADPAEQTNLADRGLPEADRFSELLSFWRRFAGNRLQPRRLEIDERHLESLRGLGYIQ